MKKIIIGSRRSNLAKVQANIVIDLLKRIHPDIEVVHKLIGSEGDRNRKTKVSEMGGIGAFTKEIQEYLLSNEIDVAVHSLKDLPTELPEKLLFTATLLREAPNDAMCGSTLEKLQYGAKVGTGSLKRKAQLLSVRPDIQVIPIRGNVPPRLAKIKGDNPLDAVILACAGINRLGMSDQISEYLDIYDFLPCAGQGALGLEVRKNDQFVIEKLKAINDNKTFECVSIERNLLNKLHGGCSVPIGTYCEYLDDCMLQLSVSVTSIDGKKRIFLQKKFEIDSAEFAVDELYRELLLKGADKILEEVSSSKKTITS